MIRERHLSFTVLADPERGLPTGTLSFQFVIQGRQIRLEAAYVGMSENRSVLRTAEFDGDIHVDLGKDDEVLGIEFLTRRTSAKEVPELFMFAKNHPRGSFIRIATATVMTGWHGLEAGIQSVVERHQDNEVFPSVPLESGNDAWTDEPSDRSLVMSGQ